MSIEKPNMKPLRMTSSVEVVLRMFVANPRLPLSSTEIVSATGVLSGTIVPILHRMEEMEMLESDWEDVEPSVARRPRRRYYQITPWGIQRAHEQLAIAEARRSARTRKFALPQIAAPVLPISPNHKPMPTGG